MEEKRKEGRKRKTDLGSFLPAFVPEREYLLQLALQKKRVWPMAKFPFTFDRSPAVSGRQEADQQPGAYCVERISSLF